MLEKSGDLIPVKGEAVFIPWTKRKSQVLNFLHRGPVNFETHVYDTNVGDISPLSAYFNPDHWTVHDLNYKFGIQPQNSEPCPDTSESHVEITHPKTGQKLEVRSLCPRLLIYPLKYEDERGQASPEPGSSSSFGDQGFSPLEGLALSRSSNHTRELERFFDLEDPGEHLASFAVKSEEASDMHTSFNLSSALTTMANRLQTFYPRDNDLVKPSKSPLTALCMPDASASSVDFGDGAEWGMGASRELSDSEESLSKLESRFMYPEHNGDQLLYIQETLV